MRQRPQTGIFGPVSGVHHEAEILATDTPSGFAEAVHRAAAALRAGGVVALPTETVYGLAANALDAGAVARIFEIKGRPAHNPLIVHIASLAMARGCAVHWPALADKLAAAFWPGPLTLVLARDPSIPEGVTAGGATVGIRWPSHPLIQAVIRECGFPLAAPSANLSNRISPTCAEHVRGQLGNRIELIVDGGPSQVGIESTVLDVSGKIPRVLRPGMIHDEALLAVTGRLGAPGGEADAVLRSPGMLKKHYAPKARLVIRSWRNTEELAAFCSALGLSCARVHVLAHSCVPSGFAHVSIIPREPGPLARALYAELHRCDEAGAELIIVEALPQKSEWRALADRLARAAAG